MLCKKCKSLIPDNSLSCPKCNKYPYIENDVTLFQDKNYLPAKWWKRLLNYFIDMFFFYFLIFIFAFIFGVFSLNIFTNDPLLDAIMSLGYYSLYYILTELIFSRSHAKFITRTSIVGLDAKRPNLKNIIIRTFSRFIPFEPFSLLSSRPIGWHDSLSKTLVVEITNKSKE